MLNRLARDGVRVRSYVLGPGETVRCAVWADDEVLVARLRGDFTGVSSVDAEMRLETGEEWEHATDVPVPEGATELVLALPAALVRKAPIAPMRLTLRAAAGSAEREGRRRVRLQSRRRPRSPESRCVGGRDGPGYQRVGMTGTHPIHDRPRWTGSFTRTAELPDKPGHQPEPVGAAIAEA